MSLEARAMHMTLAISWATCGVFALVASLGCAGLETRAGATSDGGASPADAGRFPPRDAASVDGAPPGTDGGGMLRSEADALAGCYDFSDDDGDGDADCDDSDCGRAPICCVGSALAECCRAASGAPSLTFTSCGAGEAGLRACAPPGSAVFGGPDVRDGMFVPLGSESADSGLALPGVFDPQLGTVSLRATIAAGDSCPGCVEFVAIGLVADSAFGAATRVAPIAALSVSASTGELRIVVGGAVRAARALDEVASVVGVADATAAIEYELELGGDGIARVLARGPGGAASEVLRGTYVAATGRAVLYGRSLNRASGSGAPPRAASVDASSLLCDMPAALTRDAGPLLPDAASGWWQPVERLVDPSVARRTDAMMGRDFWRLAFVREGRIHFAAGNATGDVFGALADPSVPSNSVLRASDVGGTTVELSDPELLDADGHWRLYFAAIDAEGVSRIYSSEGAAGYADAFGPPRLVLDANASAERGFDDPSVLRTATGTEILVARRLGPDPAIVIFDDVASLDASEGRAAGTFLEPATRGGAAQADDVVHRPRASLAAFDHDEVAAPALAFAGGVWRIYYAGRRGTRWGIGLLISEDRRYWRLANDGEAVLRGDGEGFDALGVAAPSVATVGGEVRLYHGATDGVAWSIALARRPDRFAP